MEDRKERIAMLDLMQQPAFCVEQGFITHVNPAAGKYLLSAGTQVAPLIGAGYAEYEEFADGCLYLTMTLGGSLVGVSVTKLDDMEIWLPEQQTEIASLRAMALAAAELREPLSGAMSAADQLLPAICASNDPALQQQAAQINRRLSQMLRAISNMSDALLYANAEAGRMECVEICAFVEEILEKTAYLAEKAGISVTYKLPAETVFTLADTEKLERAIYNLLSNAMKYTPSGSCVDVQLTCRNNRLYLSVTDSGSDRLAGDIYTRFKREPGLHDSRWGIGLGMVLVRSVATLHGGAVLMDRPDGQRNRITLSLAVSRSKNTQLHSPILRIDYAGERDHCLLELSDVLPYELYTAEDVN